MIGSDFLPSSHRAFRSGGNRHRGSFEMTEVLAPFGEQSDAVKPPAAADAPSRTPVLITEQQVLFATAAAVPLRPARSRRWVDAVVAFVTMTRATAQKESRPKRRHYPSRHDFLEDSRMAREMLRL